MVLLNPHIDSTNVISKLYSKSALFSLFNDGKTSPLL